MPFHGSHGPIGFLESCDLSFSFAYAFWRKYSGSSGSTWVRSSNRCPSFQTWASISLRSHRSWSFVEIGNFDRIIWQADQGNSAHDYHPTDYDTERYGCGMSTCQRGDKRRYPDNEAADANTDPNDIFISNLPLEWDR